MKAFGRAGKLKGDSMVEKRKTFIDQDLEVE
jgi:hypothetical protein